MDIKTVLLAAIASLILASAPPAAARDVLSLDNDWRFFNGDVSGAEQPRFDDSLWPVVRLPHDWSIAGPFAETNRSGTAGAFLPGGVAWYRKHFALTSAALDQRVFVEFDGVTPNSDVWINGMHLGHHTTGWAGIRYELPAVMLGFGNGTNNILAVCADTPDQPGPPWYTGAGIYRHVRLILTDPVHIAPGGAPPSASQISPAEATAQIETAVVNESATPREISLQTTLLSPDGDAVGALESSQTIPPGATATVDQPIAFPKPRVWTPNDPALYHALIKLRVDGQISDEQTTPFAIRDVHFGADNCLLLNGKRFKLKAVSLYPDAGAFGTAVPLSIWESRLRSLKSLGVNAVHTLAHPSALEFLGLCDRLGLLVIDEFPDAPLGAENSFDVAVDYLGGSAGWPAIGCDAGLLDRTGAIRPRARELQSAWSGAPMVALARRVVPTAAMPADFGDAPGVLLADWTPKNLKPHTENVEVCSNCRQVELFLNGNSLGKQTMNPDASLRHWHVWFAPGVLRAIAGDGETPVATNELRTAGKPLKIVLGADGKNLSPAWDDVSIVRASIVDAQGTTIPGAGNWISFKLSGPGVIAAVDNANNAGPGRFQTNSCPAFQGRCAAFIKAAGPAGKINLTATAAGLKPAILNLTAASEVEP